MKWKDLSLKERKQIYDSVRVNNPGATYFDIKEQFDSIPAYEDGGKSIVDEVNKSDANFVQRLKSPTRQTIPNWEDQYRVLPWEKSVSTHKLSVWDNANGGGIIVPDVQEVNGKLIDFTRPPYNNRAAVENALKTGDYVDLPKFEDALWYTENYKRYYPRFEDGGKNKNVPVLPKELGLTPGTPEYLERKYQQEISRTIEQAIFPDERTRELVENVDKTYGTNYKRAYSNIAYKDMTKRGSYVKWGDTDKDGYGQINIKNIKDNILPTDINDYSVILDNNIYMPGTANHELGHVADGLAGSRKIQDFDSGKEYITNTYLNYLANSNNTYSSAELRKMGLFDAAGSRSYLLNPTEAKSHMLTLKRSLKDSGKITNWSTPVDENMILEYMRNPTSNKMVKNQYDLYRNKNEYIDRLNKLIPMEILMPLGGAGFVGHELNKE